MDTTPSLDAASAAVTPPASSAAEWPVLNVHERRVLGVLIEKAKTTPDVYPLSLNALVTGSNQKSNRDPLLNLTDVDIEEALGSAQRKLLVIKITGGRVVRWRHNLYEAWHVDKVDLAVLGELLLRGPQTEGELRSRASRMEAIDDLDALRAVLRPMSERGLVVYLSPPGRRGTVLTHGFHAPEELALLHARHGSSGGDEDTAVSPFPASASPDSSPTASSWEARFEELRTEVASLRQLTIGLQGALDQVVKQLQELRHGTTE
jgi:uncharacterized protein YceH (UPF0502 family)